MQKLSEKGYLLIIIMILLIFTTNIRAEEFDLTEDQIEIETSIVLLNLYKDEEVVKSDYFFEVLNFVKQDYILIPINRMSKLINMEIIYDRISNILKVYYPKNDKFIQINLRDKEYIGFEEWNNEPPIIYESDFYISSKALSYLLDSDIEWWPNYQEVTVKGEFEKEKTPDLSVDQKEKEKIIEEKKEEIITGGDGFKLGSINYRVEVDYRDRKYYSDNLNLKEVVSVFSRYNNWAISLREEGVYNIFKEESEFSLPLIKAKYRDDKKLIIIGDSEFNFKNTVEKNKLRGLYFSTPSRLSLKVIPQIDLEGNTEPSSVVELFVNNQFIKEITVDQDGNYKFKNINLNLQILNRIKIFITKPDGEKEVIDKKITVVEKILKEGTRELEIVAGQYKSKNVDAAHEGLLAGFRGGIALNEDLSLNAEASYYDTQYLEENNEAISSNIGFAYRMNDNTIISLDWYYGNYNGEDTSGQKLNLHYAFDKGHFDGYYFYIPQLLAELIPDDQGIEKKVMGVINFNQKWAIEPVIGTYESLDSDSFLKNNYLRFRLRRAEGWEDFFAVKGSYENIERNIIIEGEEEDYKIRTVNDRYGTGVEYKRYRDTLKIKAEANIYNNNIHFPDSLVLGYNDIDYSFDLYKTFFEKLLLMGNLRANYKDYSGEIRDHDLESEIRLRYDIFERTYLSLMSRNINLQSRDIKETRYSAAINSYINNNLSIFAEYVFANSYAEYNYNQIRLNTSYNISDNKGYLNLFADYTFPTDQNFESHFGYGAGYSYLFNNLNELEIKVGKEYESIFERNYEYYITVSFAQAFAFSRNKILKTEFNNQNHRSFVAGYVYLDENNNGKYDEGEERLSDIEMRLDNMIATSNEEGLFRFNPVFSDTYLLNFNFRNLSADYTPVTKEKLVNVRENENIFLNFGLTLNGSISGKLYLDANNNGKFDEGEKPLSWVGISLDDEVSAYTDKRGEFYFENISLGAHEIKIIKESLPSSLVVKDDYINHIYITKDNLDQTIVTPLIYKF